MHYKEIPQSGKNYTHIWDVSTVQVFDGGFTLDQSCLPPGTKRLPKAVYMKADFEERTAIVVKTATLFEGLTNTATTVKINKGSLLIEGDTLGIGDKSVTIHKLDTSSLEYDSFEIEADDLGVLAKGAVLQLKKNGEYVMPDGFNYTEKKIDDETSCTVVYAAHGIVTSKLPMTPTANIIAGLKFCQFLNE